MLKRVNITLTGTEVVEALLDREFLEGIVLFGELYTSE